MTATLGDEAFVIVNDADFVPRLRGRLGGKWLTVANLAREAVDFGKGVVVPPAEAYAWRENRCAAR